MSSNDKKSPFEKVISGEYLVEMAAVKGGAGGLKLTIWGKDGNYPHFHFYQGVDPEDGIPNNGHGGGCIMFREAKYFNHGSHQATLEWKEIIPLKNFLVSPHPVVKIKIWDYLVNLWNENNPHCQITDDNLPVPGYHYGMENYNI